MSALFNRSSLARKVTDTMTHSATSRRVFGARVLGLTSLAVVAMSSLGTAVHAQMDSAGRPADARQANPVVHWNQVAAQAYEPTQGLVPLAQTRTFSILHASIHDALNAIDRRYASYTPGLPAAPRASVEAAVAAAARDVLVALIPDQTALVESAYARALLRCAKVRPRRPASPPARPPPERRWQRRRGDGADAATQPVYAPRPGPGEYQFTAPFAFVTLPGWGSVQPFVIDLHEHALEGPQALAGSDYARDLAHVKEIGHVASTTRTTEQSEIASSGTRTRRWAGTASPAPSCGSAASMPGTQRVPSRC